MDNVNTVTDGHRSIYKNITIMVFRVFNLQWFTLNYHVWRIYFEFVQLGRHKAFIVFNGSVIWGRCVIKLQNIPECLANFCVTVTKLSNIYLDFL